MTEEIEYKGHWFLPENKLHRISGVLKYVPGERPTLELFGNFEDNPFGIGKTGYNIVLGLTNDSKTITLYQCSVIRLQGVTLVSEGESGEPTAVYQAHYVFEGYHFEKSEDLTFESVVAEIHNLDEWLGISGFLPILPPEDLLKPSIKIDYRLPTSINFAVADGITGNFFFTINFPGLPLFTKTVTLTQKVSVSFQSNSNLSLLSMLKYFEQFQNFLVLALYQRTFPRQIYLTHSFSDEEKPINNSVRLLYAFPYEHVKGNMFGREMFFTYAQIKSDFPAIIQSWFQKKELLEPAFNLLVEHFYNENTFNENTFLNFAQAAETFHARIHNHTRMSKEAYDQMRTDILSSTSDKCHEWLKGQFSFGNSLTLHTRLTELVERYSCDALTRYLGDKDEFVKNVKWSRNYYTHYSSDQSGRALKGVDLFYLTMKLKILLVCAFLIEIGFKKEELSPLIERNKNRLLPHLWSGL